MDRYEIQCRVGQGAYGTVLRARHRQNGQTVAIKRMSHSKNSLGVLREVCALRNLSHKNILLFLDNFCSADTVSLVTEFVNFQLSDLILDSRRPKDDSFILFFYEQILSAVEYIHSVGVMHRDLKPENILLTSSLLIKIADFGQACLFFQDEEREYEENVATRSYRAPELLFGCRRYGPSVDIWALGCVLAEFVTGCPLLQVMAAVDEDMASIMGIDEVHSPNGVDGNKKKVWARLTQDYDSTGKIQSKIFQGRSDIEQISKVFGLLGTPCRETWPSWEEMPDAGKLVFDETAPLKDWVPSRSPLTNFSNGIDLVSALLRVGDPSVSPVNSLRQLISLSQLWQYIIQEGRRHVRCDSRLARHCQRR